MLQEMVHQLLTPGVVSFNAAISACEKGKLYEGAVGLLKEMVHQLLTPNVVSFSAAISACEKGTAVGRSHWSAAPLAMKVLQLLQRR